MAKTLDAILREIQQSNGNGTGVGEKFAKVALQQIKEAKFRISDSIHRTPMLTCETLDIMCGREAHFKCESFQKVGSFKTRGAINAVLKLKSEGKLSATKGVVTHSSGNHGQSVAWAASKCQVPCHVAVTSATSQVKRDAIKGYGAELIVSEPTPQARDAACKRIVEETGAIYISTFDDDNVIAGQGTVGIEMLEDVPDLDAILVPISGGGIASGLAMAAKAIKPDIKVFLVTPNGKNLEASLRAGKKLWNEPLVYMNTVADGLRRSHVGDRTFPFLCELVEKTVFEVIVIEVSGAACVAALLSDRMKTMDDSIKKVGVVIGGGNADLENLPWINNNYS